MIPLTRLRREDPFFLNPDLIERVESNADTVVHMADGTEYVVTEPGDVVVRLIVEYRARVIALAAIIQSKAAEFAAAAGADAPHDPASLVALVSGGVPYGQGAPAAAKHSAPAQSPEVN